MARTLLATSVFRLGGTSDICEHDMMEYLRQRNGITVAVQFTHGSIAFIVNVAGACRMSSYEQVHCLPIHTQLACYKYSTFTQCDCS